MKYYLLVVAMMFFVGMSSVVSTGAYAADAPAAKSVVETIHLNQATAEELQALPGVGPALSERIVTYREENGPFKTIDQLTEVKGIGQAKMAKLKDRITVE